MALETRNIMLSDRELERALTSYRRVTQAFLPEGDFREIDVRSDATLGVTINMCYSGQQQLASFDVGKEHVREILVRFCLENNIPIPLEGQKTPVEQEGHLVLHIRLSDLEEERAGCAPSERNGTVIDKMDPHDTSRSSGKSSAPPDAA